MQYPVYPSQANSGNLLTGKQGGPPDARYTSLTAPAYQAPIDARYGRTLAGGVEVQDENAEADNAWAVNELQYLRELDDVQGDGIFDPPGTHPNIYPDAGVLAARYSLPGYHVREVPFMRSEVRDSTTGRPIVPVPNGAVSLDTPVKLARLERFLYDPPQPVVWSNREGRVLDESTVNVVQNPQPVTQGWATPTQQVQGLGRWLGEDAPPVPSTAGTTALKVIGAGLAAGALWAVFSKKKKGRR